MASEYQATGLGAFRVADGAWIPNDPANRDWQEYQQWLADGGVPDPFTPFGLPPPPEFPNEISDRQFYQALAQAGEITEDEALAAVGVGAIPARMMDAIALLPAEQQFPARMLASGNVIFRRDSPMVAMLQHNLGWTDAQTDGLWKLAASL
jgi:hypothetical protein